MPDQRRWVRILNRICLAIAALTFAVNLLIVFSGKGTAGYDFGPAAYYYTDIPEWQKRFPAPSEEGLDNPLVLAALLAFVVLGVLIFWGMTRDSKGNEDSLNS